MLSLDFSISVKLFNAIIYANLGQRKIMHVQKSTSEDIVCSLLYLKKKNGHHALFQGIKKLITFFALSGVMGEAKYDMNSFLSPGYGSDYLINRFLTMEFKNLKEYYFS